MKLVWSPETASKAYIDTVKSCELSEGSSVAELISAMAAGWNTRLVVETWSRGGSITTSIGLSVATRHTGGTHICVVPDEESRAEYTEAMIQSGQAANEIIIGSDPEKAMEGLQGIDFLVVDRRVNGFARILRMAKLGQRGAVLICKNGRSDFRWGSMLDGTKLRIVRSMFLPVGNGLDIAHVGATGGAKGESKWIKCVDRLSGEELVIRK